MSQSTIGQRISEGMKAAKARRAAMPRNLARELKVEQQARQRLAGIGIGLLEQVDALEKKSMTQEQCIIRLEGIITHTLLSINGMQRTFYDKTDIPEELRLLSLWIKAQCAELRKEEGSAQATEHTE